MRNLLLKFKIIDSLELDLNVSRRDFAEKMAKAVEPGSLSIFNGLSEAFSRDSREYIGNSDTNGFHLKQKRRFFSFNKGIATAKGVYKERNGKLNINIEINGMHKTLKFFFWLLVVFYTIGISFILFFLFQKGDSGFISGLAGIILHAAFMFGIFFLIARAGAKKLKYDLERELFFIANEESGGKTNKT